MFVNVSALKNGTERSNEDDKPVHLLATMCAESHGLIEDNVYILTMKARTSSLKGWSIDNRPSHRNCALERIPQHH